MAWQSAERYQMLLKINNAIVKHKSRETLFRAFASELKKIFHYDRFSIYLYDSENEYLKFFAEAEGIRLAGIYNSSRPLEKKVVASAAIRSRKPVIIPDLRAVADTYAVSNMLTVGLRATIVFPMIVRDEVLGTIHFGFRKAPKNMEELVDFLTEVATQAAIAVDNMLSYTTLREVNENLERQKRFLQSQTNEGYDPNAFSFSSPAMQDVLTQAEMIAETDASVLISGETGTGKDFLAHHIHHLSPRRDALLVKITCPALASSLLESELFGHTKGAFTGADTSRMGRFELASGGTVFLDEIGDLPLQLQAKILNVIQDRAFERVGESRPINVDFRLIAATNRNLEQSVKDGSFRSDLYYRLNTVCLHIPPLRDRTEDIPLLLMRINESQARNMQRDPPIYPSEVVDLLCQYSWPGNIRELMNLVSRMVILRSGHVVTAHDIHSHLFSISRDMETTLQAGDESRFPTLDEAERAHLERALIRTQGIVAGPAGAAAILGVPRSTLVYRMKRLGLNPLEFRASAARNAGEPIRPAPAPAYS